MDYGGLNNINLISAFVSKIYHILYIVIQIHGN